MGKILKGANTNDDMQKYHVHTYIYQNRLDKLIRFDLGLFGCKHEYYMYAH